MLKKTRFLFFLLFTTLFLVACGDSSNSPAGVATAFFKAVEKNDKDTAVKLLYLPEVYPNNKEFFDGKITMLISSMHTDIQRHNGIKKIDTDKIDYSEDKKNATVITTITYHDGETHKESTKVINDKGKWLINL